MKREVRKTKPMPVFFDWFSPLQRYLVCKHLSCFSTILKIFIRDFQRFDRYLEAYLLAINAIIRKKQIIRVCSYPNLSFRFSVTVGMRLFLDILYIDTMYI